MTRHDGRQPDQLRPITIQTGFTEAPMGSVLISAGKTVVLCTASVADEAPRWMKGEAQVRGWVTAEYAMLPGSTQERNRRERGSVGGRTQEIQRLIGRSLRAVIDLHKLGPRTITLDCDVLQADGGTRTTSITGAYVALSIAIDKLMASGALSEDPRVDSVAAVSCGIVGGAPVLDLPYVEDVDADVDMNVVMTGSGRLIEVQGTGEEATFTRAELNALLDLAEAGITQLSAHQQRALTPA